MSNVLPFITRLAARGDWSSGERARLIRMAEQLSHGADDLDVAFGRTDEGDPWCAVVDRDGDVLVHVARVGGRFIVHQALGDVWAEGTDLLTVLRSYLGAAWVDEPAEDVVVRLDPEARKSGQGFTALIIATAFYYATAAASDPEVREAPLQGDGDRDVRETAGHLIESLAAAESKPGEHAMAAPPAAPATDQPAPPAPVEGHRPPDAPSSVVELAAAAPAEIAPPRLPEFAAAPPPPPPAAAVYAMLLPAKYERLVGTDAPETLTGGPGASLIVANGGDDKIDGGGAPADAPDVIDGGAGNDTIALAANTVARGGSGADTFVVSKPTEPTPEPTANELGVVLDLNRGEGDSIKSTQGGEVTVVAVAPTPDVLANVRNLPGLEGFAATPGERLIIDIDGDGKADGVLLVAHVGEQLVFSLQLLEATEPPAQPPGLVGAPVEPAAPF